MVSEALTECLRTGRFEDLTGLYAPDALLDTHMPHWRSQDRTPDEIVATMRRWFPGPGVVTVQRQDSADGLELFQFERTWTHTDGVEYVARQMHVIDLDGGLITRQTVFCAGMWSPETVEKIVASGPLSDS